MMVMLPRLRAGINLAARSHDGDACIVYAVANKLSARVGGNRAATACACGHASAHSDDDGGFQFARPR